MPHGLRILSRTLGCSRRLLWKPLKPKHVGQNSTGGVSPVDMEMRELRTLTDGLRDQMLALAAIADRLATPVESRPRRSGRNQKD